MHSAGFLFLKKTELPLSLFVNVYMAMLLINWDEATAADLSGFTVNLLHKELGRHRPDITGSKEDIIKRLLAYIMQGISLSANAHDRAKRCQSVCSCCTSDSPVMLAFITDIVENIQLLVNFLQQN